MGRSLPSLTQSPVSPSNCQNKGAKECNQKRNAFLKASIKIQEHSDFYQYFQHNALQKDVFRFYCQGLTLKYGALSLGPRAKYVAMSSDF